MSFDPHATRPSRPSSLEDETEKGPRTAVTLIAAAEGVARASGHAQTVMDVLKGRVLGHFAEGLRQFLAVRTGSVAEADQIFARLSDVIAGMEQEELMKPPGARARLYRLARELSKPEVRPSMPHAGRQTLPWREPRASIDSDYEKALHHLREGGLGEHAELLELAVARELTELELAFVLGIEPEEVEERLEQARLHAKRVMEESGGIRPTAEIDRALLEAFALEPLAKPEDHEVDVDEGDAAILAPDTVIGGRYRVLKKMGAGGFAQVYRCADTEVEGHIVALKILHRPARSEAEKAQALRELHIIASVFHPSIVQFKDHGYHEGRFWFVMPWYDGESLEERMLRKPLSRAEAKAIFVPLAKALSAMHAVGIRHQDVKPENIMLAKVEGFGEGEASGFVPVLLDLGVAAKEAELVVAGTPTYFAPEVAAQFAAVPTTHPIGTPSDIFSLALSLRNALEPSTAEDIVSGAVDTFIANRARNMPAMPRSKELRYLQPYFERWMSEDPTERPTADELAEELSVLSLPEERKARRWAILRVVVPLLFCAGALFAVVAWQLQQTALEEETRAKLAMVEAQQARANLEETRADLEEEAERAERLEARTQELQSEYESSQLTREELAVNLAKIEAELEDVTRQLGSATRRLRSTARQLAETEEQLASTRGDLESERRTTRGLRADVSRLEGELSAAQTRVSELRSDLATRTEERDRARAEAQQANDRVATLTEELGQVRAQVATVEAARDAALRERDQAQSGEATAVRERDQARRELEEANQTIQTLRRRISQLERELAEARAGGGGGDAPEPTAPTPTVPDRQPPLRVRIPGN